MVENRKRAKVLIFIDWFLPGYKAGGPIKSVYNIVENLKNEYCFSIVTSNTDFGSLEPYESIETNVWLQHNGYRVMYLDAQHQKVYNLNNIISANKYDFIYLNSLFSINFTLKPLLANKFCGNNAKVVLAPRGMLGKGALDLKKNKKLIFLRFSKALGLFKNVTWHASTAVEATEIKEIFGGNVDIKIALNIASLLTDFNSKREKNCHNTKFFFVSRISPKKNLLGALEMLSKVSLKNKIEFNIIGPVEDEAYWHKCQGLIANLPPNIIIKYLGAIPNSQLPSLLQNYHFLLLPTFSENYGHVMVEAWANGCPVIISDQTPWRNLMRYKVGWDISLHDKDSFINVLEQCILMEDDVFQQFTQQTLIYLKHYVVTDDVLEQNRGLFQLQ